MKEYPLHPEVKRKALELREQILEEHRVNVVLSGSERATDAIFIMRGEFYYRLDYIRDAFFEGDGLILEFEDDTDIRPIYIMISHIRLAEKFE